MGLTPWAKDPAGSGLPGVGFGPVTVEGPIDTEWPPRSHRELIGDLDLASGTLQDAADIIHELMTRAFRRSVADFEVTPYVGLVEARLKEGRGFAESLKVAQVRQLRAPKLSETPIFAVHQSSGTSIFETTLEIIFGTVGNSRSSRANNWAT